MAGVHGGKTGNTPPSTAINESSEDDNEMTQVLTPPPPSTRSETAGKTWKEFAVTGKMDDCPLMVIDIQGFGPLTFPIYTEKIVEVLRPFLVKSDYSVHLGEKRVFDENIRLSYEVPSSKLKFVNPSWEKYMKDILLPKIGGELGFDHLTTRVDLQKLLFYEKGSFFSAHSDRVQGAGHFGTLIIQLPSRYTGGQLRCSYGQLQKVFDYSTPKEITNGDSIEKEEPIDENENMNFDMSFAGNEFSGFYSAFYLDVEHEVYKVTSGIRACLVYTMINTNSTNGPLQEIVNHEPMKKIHRQFASKSTSKAHKRGS